MSESMIVGGALLLFGIVIMVGSSRDRHPSARLMAVVGAIFTLSGASSVARELTSGRYRSTVLVVWPIVMVGCAVLVARELRQFAREQKKSSQSV
jgi:phosphate/sulfate permease